MDGPVVPLLHDGGAVFESYATGRVNVNRLWIDIRLRSRHDVVAWLFEVVAGWFFESFGSADTVEVVLEPSCEWEGFTWGVVKKGKMRKLRESRYDLV